MRSRGWRLVPAAVVLSAVTAIGGQTPGPPVGLAPAQPDAVGFSAERLQLLDRTLQQVAEKEFAGMVTILERHGKVVHSKTFGKQDLEKGVPIQADTIFRIASMTKPITGVAMMILFEEGNARLTQSSSLQEFVANRDRATMTLDDHPRVVSDPFGERSLWDGVPLT